MINLVKEQYRRKLERFVETGCIDNGRCVICNKETEKSAYTCTDYVGTDFDEFDTFAEEIGTGWLDIPIGADCLKKISGEKVQ